MRTLRHFPSLLAPSSLRGAQQPHIGCVQHDAYCCWNLVGLQLLVLPAHSLAIRFGPLLVGFAVNTILYGALVTSGLVYFSSFKKWAMRSSKNTHFIINSLPVMVHGYDFWYEAFFKWVDSGLILLFRCQPFCCCAPPMSSYSLSSWMTLSSFTLVCLFLFKLDAESKLVVTKVTNIVWPEPTGVCCFYNSCAAVFSFDISSFLLACVLLFK